MVARSLTGLKNFVRYARYTVSAPTVIAPVRIRYAPLHSTNCGAQGYGDRDHGDSSDFTRRAASAALTVAWLTRASSILFSSLAVEGLDHLHRFQSLLHYRHDLGLLFADGVGRLLHGFLEARDEEQQEMA